MSLELRPGRGRATRAEPGPRGRAPTAAHLGRGSRQRGHARRGDRMRRSFSRVACSLLLTLAGAGWAPRVALAGQRLRLSAPPPSVLLLRRRRARVPTTSSSSSLCLLPSPPSSFPNQNTNTRVQRRNHFRRLRHVAARSKVRRVVTSAVAPYQRPREGLQGAVPVPRDLASPTSPPPSARWLKAPGSGARPPLAEQTSFDSLGSERPDGRGRACITWPRPQSRPGLLRSQLSLPLPATPSGAPLLSGPAALCGGCEAWRKPEGRRPCLSHMGLFRTGSYSPSPFSARRQ